MIGVVHLLPLPGSPGYGGSMQRVVARAEKDAAAYAAGGVHALVVENYGDAPFYKEHVPAETIAALTRCALAVGEAAKLPIGINVLRNDARAALGVAAAVGATFVRINVHSGAVVTDQGIIEGRAAETLRARRALEADIKIFADVHVKHGRPLVARPIAHAASDVVNRGGADALIVSGPATGSPTDLDDLRAVRDALPDAMLLAGSGVTASNVAGVLAIADAVIVGTALKRGGKTSNPVDPARVKRLVAATK